MKRAGPKGLRQKEKQSTSGQGSPRPDTGFWGCFLELSACSARSHTLTGCHLAMLRYCGATQGLRECDCFLALGPVIALGDGASRAARCHSVMSTCCHAVIWTPARGQREDKKDKARRRGQELERTKDKKRTTRRQGLEAGWQLRPSWTPKEQEPARPETVSSSFFS